MQTVRGDYAGATAACARLSALADELVTTACLCAVAAVTGRAAKAEALLELTLRRSAGAPAEIRLWVLTQLAEMAARRGDAANAAARFVQALALDGGDSYLLGAYADFLLDQGRGADALHLLRGRGRVDALLLRQALALRQDAAAGPALAQLNWGVQKEPADMRIVLEAALQARDPAAAAPVLRWIAEHRVEDQALARLAKQLRQLS